MSDRQQAEKIAADLVEGLTLRQAGARHGVTYERVRQIVAEHPDLVERVDASRLERKQAARTERDNGAAARRSERRRAVPRPGLLLYTDEGLEATFREFLAASGGQPVSSRAFIEWLAARGDGAPSAQTFLIRFGPSWSDVCVRFGAVSVGGRGRAITRASCETAVRRIRRLVGRPPTAAEYETLKTPEEPSRPVVAARLGGGRWSGVTAYLIGER